MYGASSASAASAFALLNRGFSERLPSTVRKGVTFVREGGEHWV